MKKILFLFFLFILINNVSAATIYGKIYDLTLNREKNVIVQINTNPEQRILSEEGIYEFEVPVGNYTVRARKQDMYTEENITVIDDGIYVIDLFLYVDLSEEESLYEDIDFEIDRLDVGSSLNLNIILIVISLMALFSFVLIKLNKSMMKKEMKKELRLMDDDLEKIIKILQKNKGRMTQKELRKNFALSEAKVSLMISELETEGKIKKIKKGRGNIIILENFR